MGSLLQKVFLPVLTAFNLGSQYYISSTTVKQNSIIYYGNNNDFGYPKFKSDYMYYYLTYHNKLYILDIFVHKIWKPL